MHVFFPPAFIGHTDSIVCTFDEPVDVSNGGCSWQLVGGVTVVAENAEPPLPTVDAGSNPQGTTFFQNVQIPRIIRCSR